MFISLGLTLTSCLNDDDEHAEATVDFQAVLTSLNYSTTSDEQNNEQMVEMDSVSALTDTTNVFDFSDYLAEAFESLGLIGEKSRITESTRVEGTSSINYAVQVCADQANEKIQKKLAGVDIEQVRNIIFTNHKEEMIGLGYNTQDEIPFTKLSASFTYYNSINSSYITYTKVFL